MKKLMLFLLVFCFHTYVYADISQSNSTGISTPQSSTGSDDWGTNATDEDKDTKEEGQSLDTNSDMTTESASAPKDSNY